MLLKSGPCFTAELELNCPTIVACVAALPVGAPAVAGDLVLGPDNQYHALPASAAPATPALSIAGNQLTIAGGNTVTLPDNDTQDLSIIGNVISLTNGGSVTLPTSVAPVPQVLSIAGNTVSLSGGGGSVTVPDLDNQALSISGNVLSLTNGGSVTLPGAAAAVADGVTITGSGTVGDEFTVDPCAVLSAAVAGASTAMTDGDKVFAVDSGGNCQVRHIPNYRASTQQSPQGAIVKGVTGAFNYTGFSGSSYTFTIPVTAVVVARIEGMINFNADATPGTGQEFFAHSIAQLSVNGGAWVSGDDAAMSNPNDAVVYANTGGPHMVEVYTLPAGTHTISGRVGVATIVNPSDFGVAADSARLTVTVNPIF